MALVVSRGSLPTKLDELQPKGFEHVDESAGSQVFDPKLAH